MILTYPISPAYGVSEEAQLLSTKQSAIYSQITGSVMQSFDLADILQSAGAPNWDGYGAEPVTIQVIEQVQRLLRSVPMDLNQPVLAPEPDGAVSLEWYKSPSRLVSVSINASGMLCYAAINGHQKNRGSALFYGRFPDLLASLIRKL